MNLRFVEAFHWAATLKSVTRAAEKLFITQSALSSHIASLESELGVLLLDRRDKQFRLTTAGTRFQRDAERLLNLQRDSKAEFGSGAPGAMSLRIGVIESVLHSWLIDWLQALRREHPTLELALTPLPIHLSWRDEPATPAVGQVLDSVQAVNRGATASSKNR